MIRAAWKCIILQRAPAQLKPFQQACACIIHKLELNRPTGLLLNDGGSISDLSIADNVADPDFHQIATAQLAVDSQIKKRSISTPVVLIQIETDCPNLAGLEGALRPDSASRVP
tara:strand:- start:10779 stop:11120 length:342 start_codon:yes stop_codon:yes gene_type:complete